MMNKRHQIKHSLTKKGNKTMKITIIMTDSENTIIEKMVRKIRAINPNFDDHKHLIVNNEIQTNIDGNNINLTISEKMFRFLVGIVNKLAHMTSVVIPLVEGIAADLRNEYDELDIEDKTKTYKEAREELDCRINNLHIDIINDLRCNRDCSDKLKKLEEAEAELHTLIKAAKSLGIIRCIHND